MNLLRKIGQWCWDKKERMILVIMLVVLGYRIYTVINVAETDIAEVFVDPKAIAPVEPYPPAPRATIVTENVVLSPLVGRSIFKIDNPGRRDDGGDMVNAEDQKLEVLRIIEKADGKHKAMITTGGKNTLVDIGESFESYQLVSVDIENQSCEIYSENSNSYIQVSVK